MKKPPDRYAYTGSVRAFVAQKVYLNVSYLKAGVYEINIVYKEKIIKKVRFTHP